MTDAAPSAVLTGFEKQAAEAVLTRAGVEQDEVRAAEVIWDRDHVLRLELADGRSVVLKRRRDEEDAGNQGFETELAALELSEIDQITPMLREKGNLSLVHGDPCPDNVLLFEDGCRIFDFEISGWSSVVLDAAYLLAPFPSCWCLPAFPPRWPPRPSMPTARFSAPPGSTSAWRGTRVWPLRWPAGSSPGDARSPMHGQLSSRWPEVRVPEYPALARPGSEPVPVPDWWPPRPGQKVDP